MIDWVKDRSIARWTYAFDVLPSVNDREYPVGFLVPATRVYSSGEQVFSALEKMLEETAADREIDLLELYHGGELGSVRDSIDSAVVDEFGSSTDQSDKPREEL